MFLTPLFKLMAEKQASDLFISAGAPVSIKILGNIMPVNAQMIDPETARKVAYEIMTDKQVREFEETMEMNFSYVVPDTGRFHNNLGPDKLVIFADGDKIQDAIDTVTDSNGDGYIIILVNKDDTGKLGGSTS